MADHGINVSRADTAVATPNTATCGIPFVIGTAPLSKATGTAATAGLPVLCTSYDEAKEHLGYDDDWAKYTVCEVMYYHFKLCACQPVIFLPVGETAEASDVAAAVEQVELCLTMFGIVPDLIMAPGFSNDATVAAVLDAKAGSINGMFTGKALVDISARPIPLRFRRKTAAPIPKRPSCAGPTAPSVICVSTAPPSRRAALQKPIPATRAFPMKAPPTRPFTSTACAMTMATPST